MSVKWDEHSEHRKDIKPLIDLWVHRVDSLNLNDFIGLPNCVLLLLHLEWCSYFEHTPESHQNTWCLFGISTLILKLEMTICVIGNCYQVETIPVPIQQGKFSCVELEVPTIGPRTLDCNFSWQEGHKIGVQVVGRRNCDEELLRVCTLLERQLGPISNLIVPA